MEKLDFHPGKCIIPPAGVHLSSENRSFCPVLQMIATQKQLIENADAVQDKIAQVQREGMLIICNRPTFQSALELVLDCLLFQKQGNSSLLKTTKRPSHLVT